MKNLKLGKKLILSYGIVLCLLILSMAVSIFNLANIGDQIENFYNGPFLASNAAQEINAQFEEMQKSVFRALTTLDATITNESINDATQASNVIQEQLAIVKEHFQGDMQLVTNLENHLTQLAPMRAQVLEYATANQNTQAAAYMEANNVPLIKSAQTELEQIISAAVTNGERLIANLNALQVRSTLTLVVLGVVSVVISVLFATFITKNLTTAVADIEHAAEGLSKGDLKVALTYESQDELGHLAGSMRTTISHFAAIIDDLTYLLGEMSQGNFNCNTRDEEGYVGDFKPMLLAMRKMNRSLSSTMGQINMSAEQVNAGSDQVSTGSQALAQGATEQASSVEELAATINDIAGQVQENAEHALQARSKANMTSEQIISCNQQMQAMISAMDEINSASQEIGKIIATIENIAFQTNILALNAAVEAARAGTAGKGFAVVADEVRSLANKSQDASKDTAALIERAIHAVQNGTQIAGETAQALLNVVEGAKEITSTIEEISKASENQSSSIEQVTLGVDQISSVVQTNSATAEESAAASEELSSQAQLLRDLVGQFRLRDEDLSPHADAGHHASAESHYDSPASFAGSGSKY